MIQFTPVGDSGVLAVCGSEISEQVNAQVMALDAAVQAAQLPGVVETVPTYAALLVTLDPLQTDADTLIPALRRLWDALPPVSSTAAGRLVEVPVCYGGDYGPDLAFVAQHAGLTEQQVIDIHCGRDYRIFMLGFLPGFPYLGGMDERIVCPRLQTPRTKIPAGAVGIGGKQTGIYPLASPGGWQPLHRLKMPDGRAGWPRTESWGCAAHWGGTRHGGTALAADLRQRGKPPAGHGAHPRKAVALFGRAEAAAVPCGARPPDRCLYRSGAGRICTRGICFDSRL